MYCNNQKRNVQKMMLHFGVIFKFKMKKAIKIIQILILAILISCSSPAIAEVYGGGYWEAIGLGNMPCKDFLAKTKDAAYKELGAVWLSGFMSGVNFTSSDVYDITWGEDIYTLTELVITRCKLQPEMLLSDIATEIVYTRYLDKNYTATKDVKN